MKSNNQQDFENFSERACSQCVRRTWRKWVTKYKTLSQSPNILLIKSEPYRTCKAVKNLRGANGKIIKTLCSTEIYQTYDSNEKLCKANNMFLAEIDSWEVQTGILSFASQRYPTALPGTFFVREVKGVNWCKSVTNTLSGKYTNYTVSETLCSNTYYGLCEFRQPRGEKTLRSYHVVSKRILKQHHPSY